MSVRIKTKCQTSYEVWLIYLLTIVVYGCAGMNPNPGERTTDHATLAGDFHKAFVTAKPHADSGEPWAQLRLGIFYENGWGVEKDPRVAVEWYEKASSQKAKGDWAEGKLVGAIGRFGYFNQNSDARIAEFNLAQLLHKGYAEYGIERDLVRAYFYVTNVIDESKGKAIFFCCEFASPRYFTQQQFEELKSKLESEMTLDQKTEAEALVLKYRHQWFGEEDSR